MKERKELNVKIGSRIKAAREASGFTQEKLSDMVGVSVQYISDLERGVVGTSIPTLLKICHALCLSSDYVLTGKPGHTHTSAVINRLCELPPERLKIIEPGIHALLEALDYRGE